MSISDERARLGRKPKTPRAASSYRAARRNTVLRGDVPGVWKGAPRGRGYLGPIYLNRSRRWWRDRATTYAEARAHSPFPNRAVR